MIKFRPHRDGLSEAMNEMEIFDSKEDMFNTILINWDGFISYEDLSISEDYGKDNRIDWKETRYVCTKRIGNETYDVPQCIGMCSIED